MEKFFGKYQVKREIGRGAMGSVYLAFDAVLERDVAIKTISSTIREAHLKERFIREARAAGKLCHNNIVTIYDFGVEDNRLFIAMEYLEGQDLYQLIAERAPMDIKDKLEIVRQICLGLDYAHRNDVFHRDIKPANVRLLKDGTVKIVDFGLAVMQTSSLTQSGAFLGTPNYVAPERLHGESGDGKSDQFAVGILFYELLTYAKAFSGDNISTVIFSVLNSELPALDPVILYQFPELEVIIRRAVAKNPEQRYPSMKEMADDIDALQGKMKLNGYSMSGALPLAEGQARSPAVGVATDEMVRTELTNYKRKKVLRPAVLLPLTVVILTALVLLYFLVLNPKSPKPGPVAASGPGFLSFDVKPYAIIKKIINVTTGEVLPLDVVKSARTTPLRLELRPGKYQVVYSFPGPEEENRTRVVTIAGGKTRYESDRYHQQFIEEAVNHFSLPFPPQETKGEK